jgi:hypothetical protein
MTFEELQAKAERAKFLSDRLIYLRGLKEKSPSLRHSNGEYVGTEVAHEIVGRGLESLISATTAELELILSMPTQENLSDPCSAPFPAR